MSTLAPGRFPKEFRAALPQLRARLPGNLDDDVTAAFKELDVDGGGQSQKGSKAGTTPRPPPSPSSPSPSCAIHQAWSCSTSLRIGSFAAASPLQDQVLGMFQMLCLMRRVSGTKSVGVPLKA